MANALHSAQTPTEGIHVAHAFEFANEAARDAAVYTAADEGKIVRVGAAAPYTYSMLTDSSGPTFTADVGGAPAAHAASHTDGTDDIQDATAGQKGLATAAQITKLDGIAAGATVNSTDATLLARANHTGTQTASTISDFQTAARWRFFIPLFNDSNTPWLRKSGAPYATIAKMVWPGTDNVAAPAKIFANIFCQNGGASGSIRIRDITNGLDICTVTGITTTVQDGFTDLGTLSNFSTSTATWAVQIGLDSGTGEMRCGAVTGY